VNRARRAGFDDVIVKPVKADAILRLTHGLSEDHQTISRSSPPIGSSDQSSRRSER
jgi:hypothetical protein